MKWLVLLYAFFIPSYAPVARRLSRFLKAHLGSRGFFLLMLFTSGTILAFIALDLRRRKTAKERMFFLLIMAILTALIFWLKIPEEKIHVAEFALLGFLAAKYLPNRLFSIGLIPFTAFLDESFQYILPDRVFDVRDIVIDIVAGVLGFLIAFNYKSRSSS